MYLFRLLLVISSLSLISSERCEEFETCRQCIGSTLHCVWCSDPDFVGSRCKSRNDAASSEDWCSSKYLDDPVTEDPIVHSVGKSQLQPTHVLIKARPGDTITFEMFYKPDKDYPIDVYYLFDNSWTMESYKGKLIEQASKIHSALKNLSNNVRFGVGSFVEKYALPIASELLNQGLNTFNNHLPLTIDIDQFVNAVNRIQSSANKDDPEAGLDALMQAMVCEDEIAWKRNEKERARRIIILSTDESYHSAGDGRAIGAYKPNDMKCHLTKITDKVTLHTYGKEASLLYDYPSVSQINYMAKKKDISIFFVATKNVTNEYGELAKAIFGAKYVEFSNKSDLVKIISEEYVSLTKNLEISPPQVPPHLQLELDPSCNRNNKDSKERCKIPHAGTVTIKASLLIKSCPSYEYADKLEVKPAGLSDNLTLEVKGLCQCGCEKGGIPNAPQCNNTGTYQCGICKCNKSWYGKSCQCPGASTEKDDLLKCKTSLDDKPCSGRGDCICGKCHCGEGYSGNHCQYRTDNCPMYGEKVCGGNGKCVMEKCRCNELWEGIDCTCSKKNDTCYGANSEICSGNGECKCGSCICTNDEYKGKYCDLCDTCREKRCNQLKDYVLCNYDGKKVGDKDKCDKKFEIKNNIKVEIKNQTEVDGWSEGFYCVIMLEDDSSIVYKYLDGNNSTLIWIQKEKQQPPERNIWVPIGSAIGAILLIGILTLIAWKVLVDIYDAREYRKFAKEAEQSGFDIMENPLYKPAAVSINNPAYNESG